jgi:hypothetical protein
MALPFLEVMRPRKVKAAEPATTNFIFIFTPNGITRPTWECTGTGADFQLSRCLKPLTPFKSSLTILKGLTNKVGGGCCHSSGMPALLSGRPYVNSPGSKSTGITLDQHLARAIGGQTKFRSLELAVQIENYRDNAWHLLSYVGRGQPITPEDNPYKVFDRIFKDSDSAMSDSSLIAKLQAQRKSSLDYVMEETASLSALLGGEDKVRLEEYRANVRDIEVRLTEGGGQPVKGCAPPNLGPTLDHKRAANVPVLGRLQTDLMIEALRCGLTRVVTFMWSRAGSDRTHSWLKVEQRNWHELSHDSANHLESLTVIREWYMNELAYLLGRLKATPDPNGNGSLLDSSVLVHGSEVAVGEHGQNDMPWFLAGGANKQLRGGQLLHYPGVDHPNLLVSLMNMMGVQGNTFGDPSACKGPLPGLIAA